MPLLWIGTTLLEIYAYSIQYFIDHPAVIGGPGKEVEIDKQIWKAEVQ